jgi:hypothetical protein
MTAANDCELVRVFTRGAGGTIADETIKSNQAFEVVLQAEAGQTLHNIGGPYRLSVVVKDESDGTIVANSVQAGNFGDANWTSFATEFAFPNVPAQGAAKQDHIYRAIAVLRAGNVDPIVEFDDTTLLVITAP